MSFLRGSLFVLLAIVSNIAFAQQDSVKVLQEVTISAIHETEARFTSLNIEGIEPKEMEQRGAFNLSDALSKVPGIGQITTGPSISKPVIRGLYGNRILTLISGLRFDNQQWQDEHGMGLSLIGIERVEVIKGPASILYGTDALGGIINIIEEQPNPANISRSIDVNTRFYSNTLGNVTDIGWKRNRSQRWSRIRGGFENHADYSDGNGTRVLNSRSNGYYVKAGFGFTKGNWKSENTYNLSYNNFGFIMEDLLDVFTADQRWSRSMQGPHHSVVLNIINTKNTLALKHSSLQINGGLQSNLRLENEGGGQISLNMHLISLLANAKWEKPISDRTMFIGNTQLSYENNTNYGARIIIPNANLYEVNASGFIRHQLPQWVLEAGLGVGNKTISTSQTKTLNGPGKEAQPFSINRFSYNVLGGASFLATENLTLKTNFSTGYRAPNLAELSSDGLHEGTARYEIGDPTLSIEHNINADFTVEYAHPEFFLNASVYDNKIYNYIYLAPTDGNFFGFQIYRYKQEDANLKGYESSMIIKPEVFRGLQLKGTIAYTKGELTSGGNLPFIPARKFNTSIRYEHNGNGKITNWYLEPEFSYISLQHHPGEFETSTPAYQLINFYAGVSIATRVQPITVSVSGQNLLNEAYADHLSRLKNYGILNMGRNMMLSVHIPIVYQ